MANTHSLDLELSSSQYAYVADNADVSVIGDISIEAWIKMEQLSSTATTQFTIVNKTNNTDANDSYAFDINTSDKLSFFYSEDGTTTDYTQGVCDTAFVAGDVGAWRHVAVVVDVSAMSILFYIDGVVKTTTYPKQTGVAIFDSNVNFTIGASYWGGSYSAFYDGLIDDVRMWNDIRTEAEIQDNDLIELVGNEAGLVGYWKLNNDYVDAAQSSDLTAVGSPVFSTDVPFVGAATAVKDIIGAGLIPFARA